MSPEFLSSCLKVTHRKKCVEIRPIHVQFGYKRLVHREGSGIQHRSQLSIVLFFFFCCCVAGSAKAQEPLPDAPSAAMELASASDPGQTFPPAAPGPPKSMLTPFPSAAASCGDTQSKSTASPQMSCTPTYDPFQKFINSAEPHPLTAKQKAILAGKDVIDPFNFLTIGGLSAITVATDSHSAYGPGITGWAKLSGVSLTQDMTNEFFGTFLIPSIAHQDPHYHRMPNASYKRRIAHCIYQVVWTQGDDGKGMFNSWTSCASPKLHPVSAVGKLHRS
jgi:hypothetical protein